MNTVSIPDFVDYPEYYKVLDNLELFNNIYCYIIEPYVMDGIGLYIGFRDDYVIRRISDFKSNEIDGSKINEVSGTILYWSNLLKEVMKSARVPDALFYFSVTDNKPILVDVMISANKFVGPGMLNDLFAKIVPIQTTIDKSILNKDDIIKYKGKIVKPSSFKYLTEKGLIRPQYGIV